MINVTKTFLPPLKTVTVIPVTAPGLSRFAFIDGLRGIAAVLVLLHHLLQGTMLEFPLNKILPLPLRLICHQGACGVEIFFVISGFVIAHSLQSLRNGNDLMKFVLRRQLRLDPPYWCALVLYLVPIYVERLVPGLIPSKIPNLNEVIVNAVYLQDILKVRGIVGGAWTLCLEIQFYLLTAFILLLGESVRRFSNEKVQGLIIEWTVALIALCSLVRALSDYHGPWFIDFWIYFAVGMLCYRSFREGKMKISYSLVLGLLAVSAAYTLSGPLIFAAATSSLIYIASRLGSLDGWLSQPIFQYFGKISYSLYLLNLLVAWNILKLGYKLTGLNEIASLGWFVLAGLASIGAAHLFYTFVEKPSVMWGQNLKSRWNPGKQA